MRRCSWPGCLQGCICPGQKTDILWGRRPQGKRVWTQLGSSPFLVEQIPFTSLGERYLGSAGWVWSSSSRHCSEPKYIAGEVGMEFSGLDFLIYSTLNSLV